MEAAGARIQMVAAVAAKKLSHGSNPCFGPGGNESGKSTTVAVVVAAGKNLFGKAAWPWPEETRRTDENEKGRVAPLAGSSSRRAAGVVVLAVVVAATLVVMARVVANCPPVEAVPALDLELKRFLRR